MMQKPNVSVIVIAGGDGTRMAPLITHKSAIPFLGVPFIVRIVENIQTFFLADITVIVSPAAARTSTYQKLITTPPIRIVEQKKPAGMANAVRTALQVLHTQNPVLIVNASSIDSPDTYQKLAAAIGESPEELILAGRIETENLPGGYFEIKEGAPVSIIEKPASGPASGGMYKMVMDYFPHPEVLDQALSDTTSSSDDVYEIALSRLLKENKCRVVKMNGYHLSLKYPHHILAVMDSLLDHSLRPGIAATAQIAPSAIITGKVEIGDHVKVCENAVIKGPAFIGANTIIGTGVLVRNSAIESDCEIGFNSEIARSYIGPGTKCHTSYLGDSVVEGGSNLAAGTITANLRFEGDFVDLTLPVGKIMTNRRKFGAVIAQGVKTAVHTSLMPGAVIGPNISLPPALYYKGLVENVKHE